jgi:hypothetical protein
MSKAIFCLVVAACVWILAPALHAGDETRPVRFSQQQWRIFPHAPFRRAADTEITARLTRQIEPLAAFFQPDRNNVRFETLGDSLLEAKARNQFFRLESLLRLYGRAFPDLEKYRVSVKEIEDGLGAYSYAVDSLSFAEDKFKKENRSEAFDAARTAEENRVLESLRKKKDTARVVLAKLVEGSTLGSELPELQAQLGSSLAGWGSSKDLAYVDNELQRVLKDVRDGRLNFNLLEDGIHEFRRRLRWFPMMIDSLDGLILLRDDPPGACPVPALEALRGSRAANHRYSNPELSFPATHPCTISRCLLWQVVKTTDEIGRLKDVAEGNAAVEAALDIDQDDVASSNKVTPEEIERAKKIRTELFSSHALDSLMGQLSSCKP